MACMPKISRRPLCDPRSRARALSFPMRTCPHVPHVQFRFTPPTHALLAFRQALREHTAEGGAPGRLARYAANFAVLKAGMARLGFQLWVAEGPHQGCIISTFLWPNHPDFHFERFYQALADKGFVIYPGKLTKALCFRIGNVRVCGGAPRRGWGWGGVGEGGEALPWRTDVCCSPFFVRCVLPIPPSPTRRLGGCIHLTLRLSCVLSQMFSRDKVFPCPSPSCKMTRHEHEMMRMRAGTD